MKRIFSANQVADEAPFANRAGFGAGAVAILLSVLLAACGEQAQAPESSAAGAPNAAEASTAPAAEPSVPSQAAELSVEQLLARAQRALADGRRFHPPGDNAVEYYLRIIELADKAPTASAEGSGKRRLFDALSDQSPADSARAAIRDLVPLGLMRVEGALSEANWDEADQVLKTLRATGQASEAIARLQQRLAAAREAERQARVAAQQPRPNVVAAPAATPAQTAASRAAVTNAGTASLSAAVPPPPAASAAAAPTNPASSAPAVPQVAEPEPEPDAVASAPVAVETPRVEPRLISQAAPRYPNEARRKRIEGFVELRFTVQTDGSVSEVEVVSAEPSGWFEREAVQAAKRWRFEPLSEAQQLQRVLNFRLD